MAKKGRSESDEQRLKKKVAERSKGVENPEGNAALRSLKKRLKRAQRKRRTLATRLRHAAGKATAAAEAPASAAQA